MSPRVVPANRGSYNRLIAEESRYNKDVLGAEAGQLRERMNAGQRSIYMEVMQAVDADESFPRVFFVSGHGGTGKTFLWNCIVKTLRSEGKIVLAVASSGVASLLLPNGRTAHSRFRIPFDITDRSQCSISRGSTLAALLEKTSLILWDEAPMTNRHCFEALDRTLRDVLSVGDESRSSLPFGGKTVVFGGDFRQVLPVVEGGGGLRNKLLTRLL